MMFEITKYYTKGLWKDYCTEVKVLNAKINAPRYRKRSQVRNSCLNNPLIRSASELRLKTLS